MKKPAKKPSNVKVVDPLQLLWAMHPPPWKVKIENARGLIFDCGGFRIHGFDAEFDGAYHLGLVSAVNAAAKAQPPTARLKGFRYYKLGEVIDNEQLNLSALPKMRAEEFERLIPKKSKAKR